MFYKNSSELLSWLKSKKIFAKKSFSQNFLIDFEVLEKIIHTAEIEKNDIILEIGAGPGVLTNRLLKSNAKLISVEKDYNLFSELKNSFPKLENLELIQADILNVIDDIFDAKQTLKIVANIPYNITTAILTKLCENHKKVSSATLLVQKEFAERIVAKTGKISGSISRFIQFYYEPKIVHIVPAKSFLPAPKVSSCILSLKPKNSIKIDEKAFFSLVRSSFYNRRKKLISTLKNVYPIQILENTFKELNFNENIRAEELSLDNFISLFKKLN